MRIYFFTKHEINWGSSRERIGVYLKFLKSQGHTCKITYLIPNKLSEIWLGRADSSLIFRKLYSFWHSRVLRFIKGSILIAIAKKFDVIVIQKVNLPRVFLRILRLRNKHIIFDFDDLCFYLDSPRRSFWQRFNLWLRFYQDPRALALFEYVIAGNKFLADLSVAAGQPRVSIIPTSIDCDVYFPSVRLNNGNVVIGFSGSGENHLSNLELLAGPLQKIGKKYPIRFKLIGAMYSRKIKLLFSSAAYEFIPIDWLNVEELAKEVRLFDIGVMPLVDNNIARGKCGFKALMYMASGVAAVVSPVGVNRDIIEDGVNGLWAANEDEWIKKLSMLIEDVVLRKRIAREGRKTVEERYSLVKVAGLFIDAITGAGIF